MSMDFWRAASPATRGFFEGDDAITACGKVATESPKICGGCACGESCPWEASAPVAEDPGATCGSRVAYLMNQDKEDAATACGKVAADDDDPRPRRD